MSSDEAEALSATGPTPRPCAECEDAALRGERVAMIVGISVGVVVGAACAWVLFGRRG